MHQPVELDNGWLSGLHAKDKKSFDVLFHCLHEKIYLASFAIVKNEEDARDVMMGTFESLWESIEGGVEFDSFGHVQNWLYLVARRRSINVLRRFHKLKVVKLEADIVDEESTGVAYERIYAEMLKRVADELQKLPEKEKAVIKYRFVEGLTTAETADKMNESVTNIYSLHRRALLKLNKSLLSEWLETTLIVLILLGSIR